MPQLLTRQLLPLLLMLWTPVVAWASFPGAPVLLQQGQLPAWQQKERVSCLQGNCRNGEGIEWRWNEYLNPANKAVSAGQVLVSYGRFSGGRLQGPGKVIAIFVHETQSQMNRLITAKPNAELEKALLAPETGELERLVGGFRWLEAEFVDGAPVGEVLLIVRARGRWPHDPFVVTRSEGSMVDGHLHGMVRQWRGYEANPDTMATGGLRYGVRHGLWYERLYREDGQVAWGYNFYLSGSNTAVPWTVDAEGARIGRRVVVASPGLHESLETLTLGDGSFYMGQATAEGLPEGFGLRVSEDGAIEEVGQFRDGRLEGTGYRIIWLDEPWLRFKARDDGSAGGRNYYLRHLRLEGGQFRAGVRHGPGSDQVGGMAYRQNWSGEYRTTSYGSASEEFQDHTEGRATWLTSVIVTDNGREIVDTPVYRQAHVDGARVTYLIKISGQVPPAYAHIFAAMKADDERRANLPQVKEARERAAAASLRAYQEREAREEARRRNNASSGPSRPEYDHRKVQQKISDKTFWDNYKRCGFGKC